ncbi:unnamed protein product [Phytophthora fragariaefolia]|uniref:Unnamed protein product n=1 Tax=Phytophthora fragariaefolia TaxID=1490495 RepID=A0A9W6YFA6_9STRA|nr:unnamed protein product [Phytophthora fragariaefolia]
MGRSKNKRTREEIEQAMRDNERVNATPAAPEEPAAKKRHYNLNKEFLALAVGTAEASTAAASRPPVAPAIPAPIPAPVSVPVPTPVLTPTSVSEQQRPDTNPAQERRPRTSLTASQQERVRTRDRERARARRANRTLSQQDRDRRRYAERKRAQAETSEQQEARQERERNRQQERRTNQTEQEAEAERAASREYRANLRDARHDEENEEARQNERTRRSTLRRARYLVSNIVTNPIDEATKVVTFMKGLRDGPIKIYLFRGYPGTLEAAITLAMHEEFSLRQTKLHANVPRPMPRSVMMPTGGPEPMDRLSATAAGPQQRRGSANVRCFRCGNNGHYAHECTAPVHAAKGRRDDTGYRHGQAKN